MRHMRGIVFSFLMFLSVTLIAQNYQGQRGRGNGAGQDSAPKVIGTVFDPDNNSLPYAAVSVHNVADSTMVRGLATDIDGKFAIPLKPGNYYLKISFLSFSEKMISFQMTGEDKDLGDIVLEADGTVMEELVVEAERSSVELKLDKRVFNVGKDLSSSGANAAEILDNVPSVSVDVEGNVSLRGSQNVRILIDGKPSGLVGSTTDALRQLQGNMVERVEVITNPSARYDAEGEVGIINIVLKKERRQGVNGSFEVNTGYPSNHGASYNLNYRRKSFNLFSSVGINYRRNPGGGTQYQTFDNGDTSYVFETFRAQERGGLSANVRLGADIFLSEKNTLTLAGLYKYSDGLNTADLTYKDYDSEGNLTGTTERADDERETQADREASLSYRKTFNKKEQLLTFDAKYIESDDTEIADQEERSDTSDTALLTRSSNTEDERTWLFQTDYVHPIGKEGKIEGGLKATLRLIENDFSVETPDENGDWQPFSAFNNHLIYTENIYAAYLMAGNKSGKFSYQAGIRAEYSDIKTELTETNEVNPRQYLNFFPSAHLAYELKKNNTVQVSYSRRLSRPRFRHLLPFYGYSDSRSIYGGNPDLNPEYTNSYELGHLKYWEKGSLLSSVYYRHRTGVIERIRVADSTGFARTIPVNLAVQHAIGLEFNFSWDIAKWWRINGNTNFYRAVTDGEYEGEDLHAEAYSSVSKLTSRFEVLKKYDVQLSFNYNAPERTTQGFRRSMSSLDVGISRDVLKGNGTITLSGRDLFNSRRRRFWAETDELYTEIDFQWRSRQLTLSFVYRLNQKKSRSRGGEGFGGDDGF